METERGAAVSDALPGIMKTKFIKHGTKIWKKLI